MSSIAPQLPDILGAYSKQKQPQPLFSMSPGDFLPVSHMEHSRSFGSEISSSPGSPVADSGDDSEDEVRTPALTPPRTTSQHDHFFADLLKARMSMHSDTSRFQLTVDQIIVKEEDW